jgi:hypothetical protein
MVVGMIDGVGKAVTRLATPRARSASGPGGRFSVPADEGAPSRTQAAEGIASLSYDGLLALQQEPDPREQDRRATRHGEAMLMELGALQRAMLAGGDPTDTLRKLEQMADAIPAATDPRLSALIGAIALRGRLQLARRQ